MATLSPRRPGSEPALCPSTVSLVFPALRRCRGALPTPSFHAPMRALAIDPPVLCVSSTAQQLEASLPPAPVGPEAGSGPWGHCSGHSLPSLTKCTGLPWRPARPLAIWAPFCSPAHLYVCHPRRPSSRDLPKPSSFLRGTAPPTPCTGLTTRFLPVTARPLPPPWPSGWGG